MALWHERDISHSSAERVIFPDACIVLDFMLAEATDLIARLVVYPERMRRNLESTGGAIYSQPVLLALVDAGMDRQDGLQARAAACPRGVGRRPLAAGSAAWRTMSCGGCSGRSGSMALFDPTPQLAQIDAIFRRVGLLPADGAYLS